MMSVVPVTRHLVKEFPRFGFHVSRSISTEEAHGCRVGSEVSRIDQPLGKSPLSRKDGRDHYLLR